MSAAHASPASLATSASPTALAAPASPDFGGLLATGERRLAEAGAEDPRGDAIRLLCVCAGCDRAMLISRSRELPAAPVRDKFYSYIERRARKEPVQYIIGEWEFMGLPFAVNRDVLIPRPDTECLVECVLSELGANPRSTIPAAPPVKTPFILDLCTGSGCVAVSLAVFIPNALIVAADISDGALRVAVDNARLNGVGERIFFAAGDLYDPIKKPELCAFYRNAPARPGIEKAACGEAADEILFDAICANPPYVACEEMAMLPEDVRMYEPKSALDGGARGLGFFLRIAEGAAGRLKTGGILAVEVGAGQARIVENIFIQCGFSGIRTCRDVRGIERVVLARKMGK